MVTPKGPLPPHPTPGGVTRAPLSPGGFSIMTWSVPVTASTWNPPKSGGSHHPTASPRSHWWHLVLLSPPGVTQTPSTAPTSTKPFGSRWLKRSQVDSLTPPSPCHSQGRGLASLCHLSRSPGPPR